MLKVTITETVRTTYKLTKEAEKLVREFAAEKDCELEEAINELEDSADIAIADSEEIYTEYYNWGMVETEDITEEDDNNEQET